MRSRDPVPARVVCSPRQVADACVVVPTVNAATVTPHTEAFQAVVWHGMVSHPKLLAHEMTWESVR